LAHVGPYDFDFAPTLFQAIGDGRYRIRAATFVIRSRAGGTEAFLKQVQEAVWSVNRSLPVAAVQTMQDVYERSLSRTTFTLIMLAIAGGMALALGVIGIYGVIAYAITQRRREIGIDWRSASSRRNYGADFSVMAWS
jgi:hypothetical protein